MSDDTATHQERVDLERVGGSAIASRYQNGHEAMVDEPVAQPQGEVDDGRVVLHSRELDEVAPPARQVELIRLSDELRDAPEVDIVERGHVRDHVKAPPELLDVRRRVLEGRDLCPRTILRRAVTALGRQ